MLHHQGLALDEEMIHEEHEHDAEAHARERPLRDRRAGGSTRTSPSGSSAGAQAAFARGRATRPTSSTSRARSSCRSRRSTRRSPGATTAWPASARSSAARPTTTTSSAPRRRAGSMDVQLRTGVPCAFGVLTVENMDQALARTGGGKRDQGRHAAEAIMRDGGAPLGARAGLIRRYAPHMGAGPVLAISSSRSCTSWRSRCCSGTSPGRRSSRCSASGLGRRRRWRAVAGRSAAEPSGDRGGGLPLPAASPSPVRLRSPGRIADGYPRPGAAPRARAGARAAAGQPTDLTLLRTSGGSLMSPSPSS